MPDPITSIVLTIDFTTVSLDTVMLNEIEIFNRDEVRRMTFTRDSVLPEDDSWIGKSIILDVNGETVFHGVVRNRNAIHSDETGISYAYTAHGVESLADDWPIVSPFDGTGSVTFNAPSTDPGYDPTYDGMSIGEMILEVLQEPSTAEYLEAAGIGRYNDAGEIDARTVTDLEADFLGDYRPATPVTFSGSNMMQAIRGVLQSVAPNFRVWFETVWEPPPDRPMDLDQLYTVIRFADIREVAETLTIDLATQPAPRINRNSADSFSRVVVRGGPDIRPVILDMDAGDLAEFFEMPPWLDTNTEAKEEWNIGIWYENDARKQIKGTCICRRPNTEPGDPVDPTDPSLADPNWLLVDPEDNTLTWGEDDYNQSSDGLAGFLYINRSPVTDWQDTVNRRVVFNTALTAGGKSYLQLDDPLPFTDYATFTMIPGIWVGSLTWRRYSIERLTAQGKSIAKYAQPAFPVPIPWNNGDGTPLSFTQTATAAIYFTPEGSEQRFAVCNVTVDRKNEAIILDRPSVSFFGQPSSLETGGVDVNGQPENIRVLLPVALGPLEVVEPVDVDDEPVYQGTSFTVDGVSRTRYIDLPDWVSESDTGPVRLWAKQQLDSMKDTVNEGSTILFGFEPITKPNVRVEFDDACLPDGTFDNYATTVYSCLLRFNHGSGPVPYHTELALSNRRDSYRGYDQTLHPIVASPIRPNKDTAFQAGSLMSRPDSFWQNNRAGFRSALDS
jgi:hypothetical protein